ncbi:MULTISPECIES: DUF397 domain-containing protein [unclassified Streptomyces]|uniref:DUF397 domain-containing protein n=1 Tax=unclassified Streptomyces TaxID=2593676 RepID=UPI000CD5AA18|nr:MULTISPECIES: DUF397 domain-containing protein [unclassified Streptomyces]
MSTTRDRNMMWVKSSFSGNGGDTCVEWAPSVVVSGVVPVRDSKSPGDPFLAVRVSGWSAFVGAVKRGDLDS